MAGGDSEATNDHEGEYDCQYEWAEEGSWNGTLGAAEGMKEPDEVTYSHSNQDTAPCAGMARGGEEVGEWEYEGLWVGTIGAVEVARGTGRIADITADQEPSQEDDPGRMEEESTEEESEQWDLETNQSGGTADALRDPGHGLAHRLGSGRTQRARPRPRKSNRSGLGTRPEKTMDQQWEEARRDAWLRQLLSDDSSDESDKEERYGRFAESGRWMSELYGIPQYPTATLGRECSA